MDYDSKKILNILEFIEDNFDSKSGSRYSLTNDLWLFTSSKYIYLITSPKRNENHNEIKINAEGKWEFTNEKIFSIEKYTEGAVSSFPSESSLQAYVDLENIGLNLTLRTRREGDFIVPFGMQGKMKLKKYLNSKKIPQHEKDNLILLCKDSEVLWIVGVGLSNKLKVVNKPTHVIRLI